MRELVADLFISLDGFASGTNEPAYFGYDGPDLSAWAETEINKPQVILMGRKTYLALAGYSAAATDARSARMRELPKLVVSKTLTEPLIWSNTKIITGDIEHQIGGLKQQPGAPIRTFGSVQLVKSLMQIGLVDRLRLMVFPLILGKTGHEPLYLDYRRTALQLVGTKVLDGRLVLLEYQPQNHAIST